MPATIIECLACGLPVVTTDAGGVPYLVTHNETALIVPRRDDAALAAGAERLLTEPELGRRLARNGERECRRFTWAAVRNEWLREYQRLTESRPDFRPAA